MLKCQQEKSKVCYRIFVAVQPVVKAVMILSVCVCYVCARTYYCIPLITSPDELDMCVLMCSGFIKWYSGCFSCYLYSAPLSLYTIQHDGKYFITDFCTE